MPAKTIFYQVVDYFKEFFNATILLNIVKKFMYVHNSKNKSQFLLF